MSKQTTRRSFLKLFAVAAAVVALPRTAAWVVARAWKETARPLSLYVDSRSGSDLTGAIDRRDRPYRTIRAAIADAPPGATVVVLPGAHYNESDMFKPEVNIYCEEGVVLNQHAGVPMFSLDRPGKMNANFTGAIINHRFPNFMDEDFNVAFIENGYPSVSQ